MIYAVKRKGLSILKNFFNKYIPKQIVPKKINTILFLLITILFINNSTGSKYIHIYLRIKKFAPNFKKYFSFLEMIITKTISSIMFQEIQII